MDALAIFARRRALAAAVLLPLALAVGCGGDKEAPVIEEPFVAVDDTAPAAATVEEGEEEQVAEDAPAGGNRQQDLLAALQSLSSL